jgi:transposase
VHDDRQRHRSGLGRVTEGREKDSLSFYFAMRSPQQSEAIKAVAMPYIQATLAAVPPASSRIVFDCFHIIKHMAEAADAVRWHENRSPVDDRDGRLKRTKNLWITSKENGPRRRRPELRELEASAISTARTRGIKENLWHIWSYQVEGVVRYFFGGWYDKATRNRLEPVKVVARMLSKRLDNVITYCRQEVTNVVAEGLNSKIHGHQTAGQWLPEPSRLKTVICFYCGGLWLHV